MLPPSGRKPPIGTELNLNVFDAESKFKSHTLSGEETKPSPFSCHVRYFVSIKTGNIPLAND